MQNKLELKGVLLKGLRKSLMKPYQILLLQNMEEAGKKETVVSYLERAL